MLLSDMGYVVFLVVLVLGWRPRCGAEDPGVRVGFGRTFKALAISVPMLPILVQSALLVLILEVGVALVILMALYLAGVDLSVIPHRYEVLGLWALVVVALCVSAVPWFRYLMLVYREGK